MVPRSSSAFIAAGALLLAAGCRFDQSVPDSISITCAQAADCPAGRLCSPQLLRCIKQTGDKDAPSLVSFSLTPSVVSRTSQAVLEMVTNEVTLDSPQFTVEGFAQTARVPTATGGERFTFTYTAPTSAIEGSLEPRAHLIDLSGNQSDVTLGSLRLDFTAPSVVAGSVTVRPELARPGEVVLIQVAFTEPLGATPMLVLATGEQVAPLSSAGVYASFQVSLTATTPDGVLPFSLLPITDGAGNRTSPGEIGSIRVDTHQPRITTLMIQSGQSVFSAKPGFNTFTVIAEGDVGVDDTLRALEITFLGSPLTCTSPTPTRRECTVTVLASMPEGDVTLQALATDAAGNSAGKSVVIRLDFTPPTVVPNSLTPTFTPGPGSHATQVTALGAGARVDIGFSATELLGASPVMTLGGLAMICTGGTGLTQSCGYQHSCSGLTDGTHPLSVTLIDLVGNGFSGAPGPLGVLSDCLAPAAPDVVTPGSLVWQRAPYGAAWAPGTLGLRLLASATVVAEPRLTLLVGNDLGGNVIDTIAAGPVGSAVGATTLTPNLTADHLRISVQSVDAAGNASAVVLVRENQVTVTFDGTLAAPTFMRGVATDDFQLTGLGQPLGAVATSSSIAREVSLRLPIGRGSTAVSALGNGKMLLFGGSGIFSTYFDDAWVFDRGSNTWVPTIGNRPSGRGAAGFAALGAGKTLVFGGQTGNNGTTFLSDGWVHDLASNSWATIPGVQPPARMNIQMASLGNGQALLFGGTGMTGVLNDTWVYSVGKNSWTNITVTAGMPSGRSGYQLTSLNDGTLLMTGGTLANNVTPADTYLFDIATMRWSKLALAPAVAARVERKSHATIAAGVGHAVLHGGVSADGGLDITAVYDNSIKDFRFSTGPQPTAHVSMGLGDLGGGFVLLEGGTTSPVAASSSLDTSVFDTSTLTWTPVVGAQPAARYGPQLVSLEPGKAVLSTSFFTTDQWEFDLATRSWSMIKGNASGATDETATLLDGRLIHFGYSYLGPGGQLAVFSGDPPVWSTVAGAQPPTRTQGQMADLGNGRLLMFGGIATNTTTVLTDSWALDLTAMTWSQVTGIATPPATYGVSLTRLGVGQALLIDKAFNHWVYDDTTTQWSAAPAGPPARESPVMSSFGSDVVLYGGSTVSPAKIFEDTWVFSRTTHTWSQLAATLTQTTPVSLITLTTGDLLLSTPSNAYLLGPSNKSWGALAGYPAVTTAAPMSLGGHVMVFGASTADDPYSVETWSMDQATRSWTKLAQRVPATGYQVTPLGGGRALTYDPLTYVSTVFEERGQAVTGVGAVPLSLVGLFGTEVTGVKAAVTAGADGFSPSGAAADGFDLQLYGVSNTGTLFQTCASAAASSAAPGVVSCGVTPFTGRSSVALRVRPKGASNMNPVGLAVTSAVIDVLYR